MAARPWEALIPPTRGVLPNGTPLRRTEPSGSFSAPIMVLGAYPAATSTKASLVGGVRMTLPTSVEGESFEATSKSGHELDEHYLAPLGLRRADVCITDLMPYYLANTTRNTSSGRSMADNLALYERHNNVRLGIDARLPPPQLVAGARTMPGNVDRLKDYVERCRPRLMFTLGAEPAAFVRGEAFDSVSRRAGTLFYSAAEELDVLGVRVGVVHLVHPHLFIKRNATWMQRHREWVAASGLALVRDLTRAT